MLNLVPCGIVHIVMFSAFLTVSSVCVVVHWNYTNRKMYAYIVFSF
uniref:Uncharacterized protein n=1 Tax=Arundo donax TaxID=35708 RepID=A0A0A9EN68_ARUDO